MSEHFDLAMVTEADDIFDEELATIVAEVEEEIAEEMLMGILPRQEPLRRAETLGTSMRQVLAELEILPHGKTQNYAPSTGHDAEDAGVPQGESFPPHLKWRAAYEMADNDHARGKVIDAAQAELDAWRVQGLRPELQPETSAELEARVIKAGEGWSVKDTANSTKCSETLVRRIRVSHGLNQVDGLPLAKPTVKPSPPERVAKAREMRDNGMRLKQIAAVLGCDKATISRDLAA